MAKFVLAGKADCPRYAEAGLLADRLQRTLPHFRIHKISVLPDEWEEWLNRTCQKNGWKHDESPLIWRELVDQGGKGMLLGGYNHFITHCQDYYRVTSDMPPDLMQRIAAENLATKMAVVNEERHRQSLTKPLQIWIDGAPNPTCHMLVPSLLSANLFPRVLAVDLHLLQGSREELELMKMETEDMALPWLHQVVVHMDLDQAFNKAELILLLDESDDDDDADVPEDKEKTEERMEADVPEDKEKTKQKMEANVPEDKEKTKQKMEADVPKDKEKTKQKMEADVPKDKEKTKQKMEADVPKDKEKTKQKVEVDVPKDKEKTKQKMEIDVPEDEEKTKQKMEAEILKDKEKTKQKMEALSARYTNYANLMEAWANREVKVVVSRDSFANLVCSLLLSNAPSIDSSHFVAIATQLENQARAVVANVLKVRTSDVKDIIVWGNVGGRFYVDLQRAKVFNYDGPIKGPPTFSLPALQIFLDRKWVNTDLQELVQNHRSTLASHRNLGAMSSAHGILTILKAWNGTAPSAQVFSVGVICSHRGKCCSKRGLYYLPEGTVLSAPVTFKDGQWSLLSEVTIGPFLKKKLDKAVREYTEEEEGEQGGQEDQLRQGQAEDQAGGGPSKEDQVDGGPPKENQVDGSLPKENQVDGASPEENKVEGGPPEHIQADGSPPEENQAEGGPREDNQDDGGQQDKDQQETQDVQEPGQPPAPDS